MLNKHCKVVNNEKTIAQYKRVVRGRQEKIDETIHKYVEKIFIEV